jgi:hypothetical protein
MGKKRRQKLARREAHSDGEANRGAVGKNQRDKEKIKNSGRRREMDVAAYILAALAGIVFVLVGIFYATHKTPSIILFGIAVLLLDVAACLYWINSVTPRPETGSQTDVHAAPEKEFEGFLTPDNKPDPPNPCPPRKPRPPGAVGIYWGNSVTWLTNPKYILAQVNDEELLSIAKTPEGISVSAKVFSADNRIIAQIVDNKFYINRNNFFRKEQTPHSLIVYDEHADQVLNVNFLNSSAIRITGTFRHPDIPPLVITETGATMGGSGMGGVCSINSAVSIQFGEGTKFPVDLRLSTLSEIRKAREREETRTKQKP